MPRPEGWHIGFDPKAAYEQQCFQMEEGDTLLFFSDALREGCVINGEEPGTAAVLNLAAQLGRGNAKDLEFIRHSLKNQSRGLRLDDDLTLCLFQMRGSGYREGFYTHADAGLLKKKCWISWQNEVFPLRFKINLRRSFRIFYSNIPKPDLKQRFLLIFRWFKSPSCPGEFQNPVSLSLKKNFGARFLHPRFFKQRRGKKKGRSDRI